MDAVKITTLCYFLSSPISEEPKGWKIALKGLDSLWINRSSSLNPEPAGGQVLNPCMKLQMFGTVGRATVPPILVGTVADPTLADDKM